MLDSHTVRDSCIVDVEEPDQNLWQIGEFSRLSRISVRILRHYQERELLRPAWTDPFTGYRYYGGKELELAMRIRELRDVGLPIDQIRSVLGCSASEKLRILVSHGDRLTQEARRSALQLESLERLIKEIESPTMAPEVIRKSVRAQIRAALRKIIPTYGHEGELWSEIMPLAAQAGLSWGPQTLCGASFYDPDYKETDCDVEIWMTAPGPFEAREPLRCIEVPEHEAISITVTGTYDSAIGPASDVLAQYAIENGLKPGLMYNVYLVGPGSGVGPEEYVTEVCSEILP